MTTPAPVIGPGIRTAIFDCDGVLFDSNRIKSDSFAATIRNESAADIAAFLEFHAAHGGVSRYEKFNWFYRDHLGRQNWQDLARDAAATFARTVEDNLMNASEVPGARALLESLKARSINCFVVSGGAHDEVIRLIERRGLEPYFVRVLGSPATKEAHLAQLQTEGLLELPGVFFGDASSDFQAAQSFGLDFVFVSGYSLWEAGRKTCLDAGHPVVPDLRGLACLA